MPNLTSVRIDLGLPGFAAISGTWVPNDKEVTAAWELYVEMVTRTPLGGVSQREGFIREALASMYSLFDTTRSILRSHGPDIARPKNRQELSFGYLAISMLNHVLRPLLTRWHPLLSAWETANPNENESGWPYRCDFVRDLRKAKIQLRAYAGYFARVADVPELLERLDVAN